MPGQEFPQQEWMRDRRGVGDARVLTQLAELVGVPTPPASRWRAATVTMFATNPLGVTSAYHQHVQDLDWSIAESTLIEMAVELLRRRSALDTTT